MSPLLKARTYVVAQRSWLVLIYVAVIVTIVLYLLVTTP